MGKKKQAYNPAAQVAKPKDIHRGQLGMPTPERATHMPEGYDVKQLAVGYDREGGVVQATERAILTHPRLIQELYDALIASEIERAQKEGKEVPEHIDVRGVKMTPADRTVWGYRGVLWGYIQTRIEDLRGAINITDYEGSPRSSDNDRFHARALKREKFDRRRFYAWVREQPGMLPLTQFLDQIVLHDNAGLASGADVIMRKWEMGKALHDTNNRRDGEQAFYGGLGMAVRILSDAARDFHVVENRAKAQIERLVRQHVAV